MSSTERLEKLLVYSCLDIFLKCLYYAFNCQYSCIAIPIYLLNSNIQDISVLSIAFSQQLEMFSSLWCIYVYLYVFKLTAVQNQISLKSLEWNDKIQNRRLIWNFNLQSAENYIGIEREVIMRIFCLWYLHISKVSVFCWRWEEVLSGAFLVAESVTCYYILFCSATVPNCQSSLRMGSIPLWIMWRGWESQFPVPGQCFKRVHQNFSFWEEKYRALVGFFPS